MKRLIPCCSGLRTICGVSLAGFALLCLTSTCSFAQHTGGHVGGAGHVGVGGAGHVGGVGRAGAPAVSRPFVSRPITPIRPPVVNPANRSFLVPRPANQILSPPLFRVGYPFPRPRHPIFPGRPIFPIPPPGFGVFGLPFFGLGFGWGFNGAFWPACDPFWSWGYACTGLPVYDYGTAPPLAPLAATNPLPPVEVPNPPAVYYYGEPNSQYAQLYLKDGTVYNVTDYWLENGELHFKTVEEHGTKVVEHTIDFDQVDLQETIDVNTQRGFRFVLRNEPIEQYLQDNSPSTSPDQTPEEAPREPQPAQP